jgi:hypothetical protein
MSAIDALLETLDQLAETLLVATAKQPPPSPASWDSYLKKIRLIEHPIPYMYVDSTGHVTVGVGHNLTAHRDHKSLPFKTTSRFERHAVIGGDKGIPIAKDKQQPGRDATEDEKQNDFDFLTRHPKLGEHSVLSGRLKKYTTLELEQADIDSLFQKDIREAKDGLKRVFGESFDRFPLPCQAALIDLQFNLGSLPEKLVDAVKGEGDFAGKSESDRWLAAAKMAHRTKVNDDRNTVISSWFSEGAAQTKSKTP